MHDLYPARAVTTETRNNLVVVVPFHNPGVYLHECARSLFEHDYLNFRVLVFDDASTDGSCDRLPPDDDHFTTFRSYFRRGTAHNLHFLVTEHCHPDAIVVYVDGDDRLAVPDAPTHVNRFYDQHDCWVVYGQFNRRSMLRCLRTLR